MYVVMKPSCPFCQIAIHTLEHMGKDVSIIDISRDPDEYKRYKEMTGMNTVPMIFDGALSKDHLIGGNDDLQTAIHLWIFE